VIQTFDLNFETDPPYDLMQMKGFDSFSSIKSYLAKAYSENGLVSHIDSTILIIPISTDNYINVLPRLGLGQYMAYFGEHFAGQFPQLIASWNGVEYVTPVQPVDIAETVVTKEQEKMPEEQKDGAEPVIEPIIVHDRPVIKQSKKAENDREITADDLLTKDQLQKADEINEVIEDITAILNNPVDGIKNLFNNYKNREKLTKEEKETLKQEEKQRKELEKQQKAIEKVRLDSVRKVEKVRTDSIANVEKVLDDSIKMAKEQAEEQKRLEYKQKEDAAKAAVQSKEDARKQKEAERKEKERLQKERLRQREKERVEKEKTQEQERKQKEKEAEERRKQRLKEKR
jgi:hypothetical protein